VVLQLKLAQLDDTESDIHVGSRWKIQDRRQVKNNRKYTN